jgi:hypothetical protein
LTRLWSLALSSVAILGGVLPGHDPTQSGANAGVHSCMTRRAWRVE